jgi:hypothetical protein
MGPADHPGHHRFGHAGRHPAGQHLLGQRDALHLAEPDAFGQSDPDQHPDADVVGHVVPVPGPSHDVAGRGRLRGVSRLTMNWASAVAGS